MGCCSFCFAWILWSSKRGGFEQPVPRALRPAGQKRPGGAFLGRGLANLSSGTLKNLIAMSFCNEVFAFGLDSIFRIILAAYHLPHRKMDLRQNLLPQQLEQLYKFKGREQILKNFCTLYTFL